MSAPVALMLCPSGSGWAVRLTNGQELVHYRGPFARQLATLYLRRYTARLRHG